MDSTLVNYAAAVIVGCIIGAALNSRSVQALYYNHAYAGVAKPYEGDMDDYETPQDAAMGNVLACAAPMSAAEKLKGV